MQPISRVVIFSAASMLLGGCAVMDTGEVDYRRTAIAKVPTAVPCAVQKTDEVREIECAPAAQSDLYLKNFPVGQPIMPREFYSVSIDHGVIADMVEPPFAFRRAVQFKNPLHKIGEIVILANAFEFSEASATTPNGFFDFPNFGDAKVVYYNPDVQAKQNLSFSNIPVIPPTEYHGRKIGIQVVILELDQVSGPAKALFEKLEALGQSTGVVGGGAVAQTLLTLGGSMITRENNDTIFEYRFVLDPLNGASNGSIPTFEEGRYVLLRHQERDTDAVWRNLIVDPNTGQLRKKLIYTPPIAGGGKYSFQPFTDSTYVTLVVKRHPPTAVSGVALPTLEALNAAIKQAGDSQTQFTAARDAVDALLKKSVSDNLLMTVSRAWQQVEAAGLRYASSTMRQGNSGQCLSDVAFKGNSQASEIEFRSKLGAFLASYSIAISADQKLTDEQQAQILQDVARFVTPTSDTSELTTARLSEPAAFNAFLQADGTSFANAVLEATRANRGLRECPLGQVVGSH